MKTLNLAAYVIAITGSVLQALAQSPTSSIDHLPHWVNEQQKTVYFAPRPQLKVSVSHLGVDDQYYDQLEVDLSYDNATAIQQFEAMKAAYPGYQIARPILEKIGDYRLEIPSIHVNSTVAVLNGPTGPFFNFSTYISKAQSPALRSALASNQDAAKVIGTLGADVTINKVLERVELEDDTCSKLLGSDATVQSFVDGYGKLVTRVENMHLRFPTTELSLLRSIQDGCFEVQNETAIRSFKDLIAVKLQLKNPQTKPIGETTEVESTQQSFPLYYDTIQSIAGGEK